MTGFLRVSPIKIQTPKSTWQTHPLQAWISVPQNPSHHLFLRDLWDGGKPWQSDKEGWFAKGFARIFEGLWYGWSHWRRKMHLYKGEQLMTAFDFWFKNLMKLLVAIMSIYKWLLFHCVSWLCHKSFFFSKMSGKYRGFWMLGVPATLRVFCVDFASATPQGSSRLKYWVWGFTARCNPAFLKPNLTNVIQCKQFGTSEFGLLVCSKNFIWRLVLTYVDLAPAPSSVNWAWLNILNELLGPAKLFCCNNPSFLMFFVGLLTDNKPQASVRCSTNREKPRLVSKTSPWCP